MVEEVKEDKWTGTDAPDGPSKSQRKREALEVRSLAARLIGLPATTLDRMPLSDSVRRAIDDAQRIRSRVARKRQLQFVAKLLRREDPEALFEAVSAFDDDARQAAARQHRVEAWRDHLVARGDEALAELMDLRPGADAQVIRQLLRKAARESGGQRPPSAARALFRLLRDLDSEESLPPPALP